MSNCHESCKLGIYSEEEMPKATYCVEGLRRKIESLACGTQLFPLQGIT